MVKNVLSYVYCVYVLYYAIICDLHYILSQILVPLGDVVTQRNMANIGVYLQLRNHSQIMKILTNDFIGFYTSFYQCTVHTNIYILIIIGASVNLTICKLVPASHTCKPVNRSSLYAFQVLIR